MQSITDHKKKKWGLSRKIIYLPGFMLLFLMIVVPQGYQNAKIILLFIALFEILIFLTMTRRLILHPKILRIFIFYICIGLAFGIYGLFRENLGALPITKEVVLYVFFSMILISSILDHTSWQYIHNTLIYSTSFLCIYIIVTLLNSYGIWPDWLYYNLATETSTQVIGMGSLEARGTIEMSFSSFAGLMFLQPYLLSYLLITTKEKKSKSLIILVILITIVMIFSGSVILAIIAGLSPFAIFTTIRFIKQHNVHHFIRWNLMVGYLFLLIAALFLIFKSSRLDYKSLIDYISIPFQLYELRPTGYWLYNPRIETFWYLLEGIIERPLFGFGSGASHPTFIRSGDHPWNYELSYMQYLYYWGIIGCAVYAWGIYFIIKKSIRIYKSCSIYGHYALSATFGMTAFLIGNATNHYLLRFDSFYVIFLPIALINLWYCKQDQNKFIQRKNIISHGAE